jgi:class 3 adenylate cyclase
VIVSWTTRDLLAGTAFSFEDRGMHELKGIAGPRNVHAVAGVPEPSVLAAVIPPG